MDHFPSVIDKFQKYGDDVFDSYYRSPVKDGTVEHLLTYKDGDATFALSIMSNDPYTLRGPFPFTQSLEGYQIFASKMTFYDMINKSGLFTTNELVTEILELQDENVRLRSERDEKRKNLKENNTKMDEIKSELEKLKEKTLEMREEFVKRDQENNNKINELKEELVRKSQELVDKEQEGNKKNNEMKEEGNNKVIELKEELIENEKYYKEKIDSLKDDHYRDIGRLCKQRGADFPPQQQMVIEYPRIVETPDPPSRAPLLRKRLFDYPQMVFAIIICVGFAYYHFNK